MNQKEKDEIYQQTRAVYKKLGEKYIENIKDLNPKELREFIGMLPSDAKVLEIGCAGGRDSKVFLDRGFNLTGIDLVEEFIDFTKEACPEGEFYQMDVLDLDFPDKKFDAVWAHAVLLHLYDDDLLKALNNLNKVLKPGGKLFVSLKLGDRDDLIIDKLSNGEKRYFNLTTKDKIMTYLKESGFKIIKYNIASDYAGRDDVKWVTIFAEKA